VCVAPLHRHEAERVHERGHHPALQAATGEVLGLAEEPHLPADDQRDDRRVEHRTVVRREDHRPLGGHVLEALDARAVHGPRQRRQDIADELGQHGLSFSAKTGPA